jgi:hypothetical protein
MKKFIDKRPATLVSNKFSIKKGHIFHKNNALYSVFLDILTTF